MSLVRTRPAAPPTVPARTVRVAPGPLPGPAPLLVVSVLVASVLAGLAGLLGAAPALAATAPRLVTVVPQTGDVVGRSFTVRVQMLGDGGVQARFYVALDGLVTKGQRVTSSRAAPDATAFTVSPSTEAVLTLKDVEVGDHRISVVPLTPGVTAPPPVTVSVRTGTGTGPAGIVIGILLAVLFLLYRRRILNPRMRGMERPIGSDGGEGGDQEEGRDRREGWD
jgi:hypothetical protein